MSAARLRQLQKLTGLQELVLGVPGEVVEQINDRAIAELVLFKRLRALDLRNCTHVSDNGGRQGRLLTGAAGCFWAL